MGAGESLKFQNPKIQFLASWELYSLIQEKTGSRVETRFKGPQSLRHLAVNIDWINNRSRKSFKMEQVNIEDVKLTPEDIPGASFKDSEMCKLTVNQLKFW